MLNQSCFEYVSFYFIFIFDWIVLKISKGDWVTVCLSVIKNVWLYIQNLFFQDVRFSVEFYVKLYAKFLFALEGLDWSSKVIIN